MLELLGELLLRLARGEPVALCVLVRARGSTPQATGATMLVLANGQTLGTLGGGCVEAEVRTRALTALNASTAPSTLATFKLDQDYGWDDGLMCGGMMDVAVQVLRTPSDAGSIRAAYEALRAKRAASYPITATDADGVQRTFDVPLTPRPTLLIAGAGHVGHAIAALAATADFDVVVFDDRAEVASAARFPAARCVVGTIHHELARWPTDEHTFVVIVTRGHRNDAAALAAVVASPAAYVGMIGSKRKVRTILEGLATSGVSRDRLLRVHAPIGLEIGAVTPGEIAVSVCAELIAIRRGREGAATSLKLSEHELQRWLDRDAPGPLSAVPGGEG